MYMMCSNNKLNATINLNDQQNEYDVEQLNTNNCLVSFEPIGGDRWKLHSQFAHWKMIIRYT